MITFNGIPQRSGNWAWFKPLIALKTLKVQYEQNSGIYLVYGYDLPEVLACTIWTGDVPAGVIEGGYSQAQNDADKADFEADYKPEANRPNAPKTADGKPVTSTFPTEGSRVTLVTHNWCDKTTWYQQATRVVEETPAATTPGTVYTLAHVNVIDIFHGKLWAEDGLKDAGGNSYRAVVKVNGTTKAEVDPHTSTGDYSINYATGVITFSPAIATDATVLVTYHYATTSLFTIKPAAGKKLLIRSVETQFSSNIIMNDTVRFEPYGYVDYFAPQLMPGVPSGTKIPLGATVYKTMGDFQAESNGALSKIPAIGGSSWRGIQNEIIVFPWDYAALLPLSSAAGMEVRLSLEHDAVFGGEFGTATLYCLSEDEQ